MSDDRAWYPVDPSSEAGADGSAGPSPLSAGRRGGVAAPRMYGRPPASPGPDGRPGGYGDPGRGAIPTPFPQAALPRDGQDPHEVGPPPDGRTVMRRRNPAGTKKRSRARTIVKWASISMATVLVATVAFAAYAYKTTVGDIKHTALLPKGVTQAALPVDPFGDTAMNILLIGSDTRDTAEDCELGGVCGPGANADSEIILHVSADRTNATVMSIPRDTVTNVPQCSTDKAGNVTVTGHVEAQINSALQDGPECQVAADHDLTGITITGYIMFDFSGVVSMSDALGGVPVCVTAAVDDSSPGSGSGLKLPAGDSTVQGVQALEFLRTRDSFFDGSDLGREETTHYFFSQLIRTLRGKMNFDDVATLLSVGQAMARSTTVSDNFTGLGNLEGLVESLDKVPTDAITFVTMPWAPDPENNARVIVDQPDATTMFHNIQNDVSYTNDSSAAKSAPAPSTAPPAPPAPPRATVDKAEVHVGVYNADGVTGRAGKIAAALSADGFSRASAIGDLSSAATTEVYYPSGDSAQADAVASALKIPTAQVHESGDYSTVVVMVGTDFEVGSTYTPVVTAGNTSGAASAPSQSFEQNADSTGECIPVESGNLTMAHQ
jgi:LCP family protein required for cell wall assembly